MFHEIDCFPFNAPFSLGVDRRTANELSSAQWTFLFVSRQQWRLFCSLAVGPRTGRTLGVGYCHVIDETRASPCRRRSLFRDVLPLPHHSGDRLVRPSLPLSPARGCVDVVRPGCRGCCEARIPLLWGQFAPITPPRRTPLVRGPRTTTPRTLPRSCPLLALVCLAGFCRSGFCSVDRGYPDL